MVYEGERYIFNFYLFIGSLTCWAFCFISMINGPKSISYVAYLTGIAPFAFIAALLAKLFVADYKYMGVGYYLEMLDFSFTENLHSDVGQFRDDLILDAYQEVIIGIGCCVGAFFAYGSYCDRKQPIICNAIGISIINFLTCIASAVLVWTCISILRLK